MALTGRTYPPKRITISNVKVVERLPQMMKMSEDVVCFGDEVMEASDGYHTFGELYEHRIRLFISLCTAHQAINKALGSQPEANDARGKVWRSERHSDGELAFGGGWFVLGIGTEPGQQITYHLPSRFWAETEFADTLEKAPEFDGHTPEDVLNRLKKL